MVVRDASLTRDCIQSLIVGESSDLDLLRQMMTCMASLLPFFIFLCLPFPDRIGNLHRTLCPNLNWPSLSGLLSSNQQFQESKPVAVPTFWCLLIMSSHFNF